MAHGGETAEPRNRIRTLCRGSFFLLIRQCKKGQDVQAVNMVRVQFQAFSVILKLHRSSWTKSMLIASPHCVHKITAPRAASTCWKQKLKLETACVCWANFGGSLYARRWKIVGQCFHDSLFRCWGFVRGLGEAESLGQGPNLVEHQADVYK